MKTLKIVTVLLFSIGVGVLAPTASSTTGADQSSVPSSTAYRVVERGANHRVWQREIYEKRPDGTIVPHVEKITELATGMHYWKNGQWVESQEKIESSSEGAVARHGQHQVIFANNLNTSGAIDQQTPDGKRLRSNILGLSYYDNTTGKSVQIALVQDSQGELISDNQVLYPNAFDGVKADVCYTYRKGSFEQDVILREQPPTPESLGLNSASTELEVITEFLDAPPAAVKGRKGTEDEDVSWGVMQLGRGRAFSFGSQDHGDAVTVQKQYGTMDGRNILLEIMPVKAALSSLGSLPVQSNARKQQPLMISQGRMLPKALSAKVASGSMKLAKVNSLGRGYVLDYVSINANQTNFTFQGDTTYYINGTYYLSGTTILEGGAVLKYNTNSTVNVLEGIQCSTAPYHPAVFTSANDNTLCGSTESTVPGSSQNMQPATEAVTMLSLALGGNLHDIRICNATVGIVTSGGNMCWITNAQFVNCTIAMKMENAYQYAGNILMSKVGTGFYGQNYQAIAENLTYDQGALLTGDEDGSSTTSIMTLNNALLTGVASYGVVPLTTNCVVTLSTNTGIYQTVGGGSYYLATNTPYRSAGTSNIDSGVLAALSQRTTWAPVLFSNQSFYVPTNFAPQAPRDNSANPDLGYHYDPLDYAFGGCHVYTNISFGTGVAVGWFRTSSGWYHAGQGIHMDDRQVCTFNGTATALCRWARLNTVQEQDKSCGYGPGGITGWADQNAKDITRSPTVNFQWTHCSMLANDGSYFRDDWGYLIVRSISCEFVANNASGYQTSLYMTNCLFDRTSFGISQGLPGNEVHVQNCTWHDGAVSLNNSMGIPISVQNSAFDGTSISITSYAANSSYATYSYNAYTNSSNPFPFGGNNVPVSSFDWQSSWFGNYYLPANSPLINAGNTTANLVGLYHFTTQVDQTQETNSTVDIGYHYVAADSYGNPIDTDGDGIPDYLEDANGNGLVDAGESNWKIAENTSLKVNITNPRNGSTLP